MDTNLLMEKHAVGLRLSISVLHTKGGAGEIQIMFVEKRRKSCPLYSVGTVILWDSLSSKDSAFSLWTLLNMNILNENIVDSTRKHKNDSVCNTFDYFF